MATTAEAGVPVAALRSNWKKVSSTENLLAFAESEGAAGASQLGPGSKLTGVCLLLLAGLLLVAELIVLAAKLMGRPSWALLQAVAADSYYVYLVPLMVPMATVAVTLNWFSLKLFKHNS